MRCVDRVYWLKVSAAVVYAIRYQTYESYIQIWWPLGYEWLSSLIFLRLNQCISVLSFKRLKICFSKKQDWDKEPTWGSMRRSCWARAADLQNSFDLQNSCDLQNGCDIADLLWSVIQGQNSKQSQMCMCDHRTIQRHSVHDSCKRQVLYSYETGICPNYYAKT